MWRCCEASTFPEIAEILAFVPGDFIYEVLLIVDQTNTVPGLSYLKDVGF